MEQKIHNKTIKNLLNFFIYLHLVVVQDFFLRLLCALEPLLARFCLVLLDELLNTLPHPGLLQPALLLHVLYEGCEIRLC